MPNFEDNTAKIIRRPEQEGWQLIRHGAKHDLYRHPEKPGTIEVPRHRKVSPGVARSIARAAGWL